MEQDSGHDFECPLCGALVNTDDVEENGDAAICPECSGDMNAE